MNTFVACIVAFLGAALLASAVQVKPANNKPAIDQELVDAINAGNYGWKADMNEGSGVSGLTVEEASALCGVRQGGPQLLKRDRYSDEVIKALPTQWSAIEQWPQCATIKDIRDQSRCGSCWAFATVEAMSDRICVHLGQNVSLSAADVAFCCGRSCGFGCDGGYPSAAWLYLQTDGCVDEGCYVYPFPSCDGPDPKCPPSFDTPPCPNACTNKTWPTGWNARHYGKNAYLIDPNEEQIMAEMYKNGPVEAAFNVYQDFMTYKSGVYSHKRGAYLGGHAIKLIGWGVEQGVKYWIGANSWNAKWGNKGFFWFLRGTNDCGIEDYISAGLPKN